MAKKKTPTATSPEEKMAQDLGLPASPRPAKNVYDHVVALRNGSKSWMYLEVDNFVDGYSRSWTLEIDKAIRYTREHAEAVAKRVGGTAVTATAKPTAAAAADKDVIQATIIETLPGGAKPTADVTYAVAMTRDDGTWTWVASIRDHYGVITRRHDAQGMLQKEATETLAAIRERMPHRDARIISGPSHLDFKLPLIDAKPDPVPSPGLLVSLQVRVRNVTDLGYVLEAINHLNDTEIADEDIYITVDRAALKFRKEA